MINIFGYDEGEKGFMKRRFLAALLAAGMVFSNCNVLNASDEIAFSSTEESSREVVEASNAQEDIYYVNDEILPAETTGTMDDLNEMLPGDEAIAGLIDDSSIDPAASDTALADQIADESDEIPDMPDTEADFSDYMIEEATEEELDGENTDLELEAAAASVAQAIWTSGNTTFTFHYGPAVNPGDSFNGSTVTKVWSGTAVTECGNFNMPGPDWTSAIMDKVTKVVFDSSFSQVRPTRTWNWFSSCSKITSIDLKGLNTSMVTDMNSMFYGCSSLETLDLSSFDTSSVTNMSYMFAACSKLKSLDLFSFDASSVTVMNGMFYNCSSLTDLNLGSIDTSHVTDMSNLFNGCSSLKSLDVSSLDTSSAMFMNSMFSDCSSLTYLDVSHFATSNAKNMMYMFAFCSSLSSLDVSSFDISGANIDYMFHRCSGLKTILCLDPDTRWRPGQTYTLFSGCTSLAGTAGDTKVSFDSSKTDSSMAKSAILGGYFSPKLINLGICGDNINWELDKDGVLTLSGSGQMYDYADRTPPWQSYISMIKIIRIEDGIASIGDLAFLGCKSALYLVLGKDVKEIGDISFGNCTSLKSIYFKGVPESISDTAFSLCRSVAFFYAPENSGRWNNSNRKNYGADSASWDAWGDVSFTSGAEQYTIPVGETEWIYFNFLSDSIPVCNATIAGDSTDIFNCTAEAYGLNEFDGYIGLTVTGKQVGTRIVTVKVYTLLDDDPLECSVSITIINAPVEENDPDQISQQIRFPIESTYKFENLGDLISGKHYYLKYFDPVQADLVLKNHKYADGTGGQCFGMNYSAAATAWFNSPHLTSYEGSPKNVINLEETTVSSETGCSASDHIKYAFLYQYTTNNNFERYRSKAQTLDDLYQKVVDFVQLRSDPINLSLSMGEGANYIGHSILVRGIGKNTDKKTEIIVYDSNKPKAENRKLILYKENGHYTSWEYDVYSSENSAKITWSDDISDFIDAFNSSSYKNGINYKQLISTSSNGTIRLKTGQSLELLPGNTDDPSLLIPVQIATSGVSNGAESGDASLYWFDVDKEYTLEAPGSESSYDIASPNSGASFTLPANGMARVRVSDDAPNSIGFLTQSAEQYVVTFSSTDSEGTGVDSRTVSVDADSTVTVTDLEDGIVVSGDELNSVTIESEGESRSYTIPDNANLVLIDPDDPDQKVTTADLHDLSLHSSITLSGSQAGYTYTGWEISPAVTVRDVEGKELTQGTDYEISYEDNVNAGTASILVTGKGDYTGTAVKTFTISKADNTLSVSGKTATLKSKKLKRKKQSLSVSKIMTVSNVGQGTLSYRLVSVKKAKFKKYFKIDAKTGKVTVKKKLKKGTYTLTVNVTASGDTNHNAGSKTVTVKVKVK